MSGRSPDALDSSLPGTILRRRGLADSGESARVAAADASATEHRGVHADIDRIVLGSGPEDPRIFGQVTLRQRDHHAARAGLGDGQPDVAADRYSVPDPVVLGEAPLFRPGGYMTMLGRKRRASKRPCGYSTRR